jgi:ankyrin repeat protein
VKGNAALLDLLIANGADINLKSDWAAGPWGVLETAEPAEAELYLSRGAAIDIHAAANLDRVDVLKSLLDADPSLVHAKGGDGCRPLHFAKSAAAMDLLLSHGADIDARDVDHESTALQWALPRPDAVEQSIRPAGSLDRVRLLAERGATVDIFAAAALNDIELIRRALDAYPSAKTAHVNGPGYPPCPVSTASHIYTYTLGAGLTPYAVAAAFGSEAAMRALTEHATPKERLVAAAMVGRADEARALVAKDASLPASLTADDQAALPAAAWNSNAAAVMVMLDIGFDPLAKGPEGGNVLHCAAWRGLADLVDRVLAHPRVLPVRDALIAAKDPSFGSTPLGWCCHGSTNCRNPAGDYPRIARSLVAAGAVIGPNLDNATPEVRAALGR